jgi:hypothetical protein
LMQLSRSSLRKSVLQHTAGPYNSGGAAGRDERAAQTDADVNDPSETSAGKFVVMRKRRRPRMC